MGLDGKSILKLLDTEQLVNRFHLKKKMRVWQASFLVERGKLLHKRDSDKVDAQEESCLRKYHSVKELRQRAEYRTTCEQLGQKWQCVEDARGPLMLHKRKVSTGPGGRVLSNLVPKYCGQDGGACTCDLRDYKLPRHRKKFFKKKYKFNYCCMAPSAQWPSGWRARHTV